MTVAGETGPVQVMKYLCPALGDMLITHHLQSRLSGKANEQSTFEKACIWCQRTEAQLIEDLREAGGTLFPLIDLTTPAMAPRTRGPRHRA